MKKLLIIVTVLLSTVILKAQFQTATLTAAGLTCAMCTKAIFNSLEKVPVVEKVDADIKHSQFLVTFKKGSSIDPDLLKNAVEDAGFSVSAFKMTGNFNNVHVSNDSHVVIDGKTFHFVKSDNKALNGTQTITMVDKNYVTAREFKTITGSNQHPCVETGKAEECCVKMGTTTHNTRIYHVKI
ncbi:MAG TPA: heavy-metal-associated domain-containing protein [Flavitalea sp.]|nr:heavy-metal-associated domain-containing protein [Flavitalea sp.]